MGLTVNRKIAKMGLWVAGSLGLWVSGSLDLWIELPGLCLLLGLCVSFRVILLNSSAFHANYLHEILPFEREHAMDTITVTFISLPL